VPRGDQRAARFIYREANMSLYLYGVSYSYRLGAGDTWLDDAQNIVAGEDGRVAVADVEGAVLNTTFNLADDGQAPDMHQVTAFRLKTVTRIAEVHQVNVPSLVSEGVIAHDLPDDLGGGDDVGDPYPNIAIDLPVHVDHDDHD
jgi:hypothetical protein